MKTVEKSILQLLQFSSSVLTGLAEQAWQVAVGREIFPGRPTAGWARPVGQALCP